MYYYEAYTIFGALFLNRIWLIWEYGLSKEVENEGLGRNFEIRCALNMMDGIMLALFGGF